MPRKNVTTYPAAALIYLPGLSLARAAGMTLTWLSMLISGVSLIAWSVL